MNLKKPTIITVLLTTNILSIIVSIVFYFGMTKNLSDLSEEERHSIDHLEIEKAKLKKYIIDENKGLNLKEFKQKHNIKSNSQDQYGAYIGIEYGLLYFSFKNGVLVDVQ